jgi:cytochrome c oxidase subunit II
MRNKFAFFPDQASTMAGRVDALYFALIGLTLFFSLLVALTILWLSYRYQRTPERPTGEPVHGSNVVEAIWSGIPFAIAMGIFFWGATIYAAFHRPPDNALQVNVVGKQWMWKIQHLEGRREINELHVPVGRPVRVTMTSEDVIHSFFVPAFRVKQDAVPGRYTSLWFEATVPGEYHLFCAEYCGTTHSGMIGRVVAMEPAAFQAWLAGSGGGSGISMAAAGERVFQQQACASCHARGAGARGPSLAGLAGQPVPLAGGSTVVADDGYLRESIVNPQAKLVEGYPAIMPTYQGLLSEEQLLQLIAYLKSLPAEPAAEARAQ